MSLERCLSLDRTDYVDVKYYPNGDLVTYLANKGSIAPGLGKRRRLQCAPGQFLHVPASRAPGGGNRGNIPSLAEGFREAKCTSDLFALGSTLYELTAGKALYSELFPDESSMHSNFAAWLELRRAWLKIGALYIQQVYADVSCVFGRDITMGCWKE